MLKLFKQLADGRRQIVGFMVPGDFLGLAFGGLHLCSAEAVTEVTLCRFPRAAFLALCDECPALEKEILQRTSTELAAAQEQMLLLGRKTALERVASFVLSMGRRQRRRTAEAVALPMNRIDIADHLGLTVETVSRKPVAATEPAADRPSRPAPDQDPASGPARADCGRLTSRRGECSQLRRVERVAAVDVPRLQALPEPAHPLLASCRG